MAAMPATATPLGEALRAGLAPAAAPVAGPAAAPGTLLVVGGGGPLGSAVLAAAVAQRAAGHARRLGLGRSGNATAPVATLVHRPLAVALRGLAAWHLPTGGPASGPAGSAPGAGPWQHPPLPQWRADTAVLVFDREHGTRHGREAAFVRPQPQQLAAMGHWLRTAGVQRLVLLLPVSTTLLPQALRQGLASLDEQALAALGFEQLVLVRPAAAPGAAAGAAPGATGWGHRLARGLLSQLHWMVPQREQPLRTAVVARFASSLLQALPGAPAGTRVAAPELLWDWAQPGGGEPLLQAWLHGQPLPAVAAARQRW